MASTSNNVAPSTTDKTRTITSLPSTQQPSARDNTARRQKPQKMGGSSRRKNVKLNSKRRSATIDNSPEATPRNSNSKPVNVPDSPRGNKYTCKTCNYRGEKKKDGNFLKNVFKKTLVALRSSDTNIRGNGKEVLDCLPEYSGKPGSVDMLPVPKIQSSYPGFDQDVLKNTCPASGVFEEKRPWWTLKKDEPAGSLPVLQPISKIALDLCYEKDPGVFQKPPGRKTFYDPMKEDIETLKALDTVHNCENRVICNTFFSGIYVIDAKGKKKTVASKESNSDAPGLKKKTEKKDSDSDEKRKKEKEVNKTKKEKAKVPEIVLPQLKPPTVHVKFAEEPYYLHQYSRKDRNLTNNPNHRRNFVHAEYKPPGGWKEKEKGGKSSKKGLVCD